MSVAVRTGDRPGVLAGDVPTRRILMLEGAVDGVCPTRRSHAARLPGCASWRPRSRRSTCRRTTRHRPSGWGRWRPLERPAHRAPRRNRGSSSSSGALVARTRDQAGDPPDHHRGIALCPGPEPDQRPEGRTGRGQDQAVVAGVDAAARGRLFRLSLARSADRAPGPADVARRDVAAGGERLRPGRPRRGRDRRRAPIPHAHRRRRSGPRRSPG